MRIEGEMIPHLKQSIEQLKRKLDQQMLHSQSAESIRLTVSIPTAHDILILSTVFLPYTVNSRYYNAGYFDIIVFNSLVSMSLVLVVRFENV